jgi:hypothetical protein
MNEIPKDFNMYWDFFLIFLEIIKPTLHLGLQLEKTKNSTDYFPKSS